MQRLVSKTSKNVLSKCNRRFCSVSRTNPLWDPLIESSHSRRRTVSIPSARLCTCRACTAAVSGNPSALFRRFAGNATLPEEKPETKPKDARDNVGIDSVSHPVGGAAEHSRCQNDKRRHDYRVHVQSVQHACCEEDQQGGVQPRRRPDSVSRLQQSPLDCRPFGVFRRQQHEYRADSGAEGGEGDSHG